MGNLNEWPDLTEIVEKPTFQYFVNLDERGEFFADVRDADGNTVYEIHGFDIFEDGYMEHAKDLRGLHETLIEWGIIPALSRLTFGN